MASANSGNGGGPLAWFTTPSPDINYNFISLMYGGGSALAVFLFVLEKSLFGYYGISGTGGTDAAATADGGDGTGGGDDEEGALHEFTRQLEGLYLVFVPFFPCLLWSLAVRSRWLKENSVHKDKRE